MDDAVLRVMTVLEILQARNHVSGAELAARLQVDLRTVQRYIARLRRLGIPITASAGVGGSYRLRSGYRLPPMMLTNEEAFAVSLGLQALRHIGLHSFAPATEGALAKLERVLPEGVRESVHTVAEAVALEPNAWSAPAHADALMRSAEAIRECVRLRFEYRSHMGADSVREMEPYAVVHLDERWYLIGHCCVRREIRTFRLDRVANLRRTAEHFERPEKFDARRYLEERLPFVLGPQLVDVWLDMKPEECRMHFASWRVVLEAEGEGTRLRCGRQHLDSFAAILLATGKRVVVHGPETLREAFRHLARRAQKAAESVPGESSGHVQPLH